MKLQRHAVHEISQRSRYKTILHIYVHYHKSADGNRFSLIKFIKQFKVMQFIPEST